MSEIGYELTDDRRKHKATLLSFKEVVCNIGSHTVGANQPSGRHPKDGYLIHVTNDGKIFSKAQPTYIIYDSKCMECNRTTSSCRQKVVICSWEFFAAISIMQFTT